MLLKAIPRQNVELSKSEFKAMLEVLLSGNIFAGPYIKEFEQKFAEYIGVKYALAVSSGRAAQLLALQVLNYNRDEEIILPAYTFHIVPLVIKMLGLKPKFVDINANTYNINTALIEKAVSDKTRAILATHILGQPCDLDSILKIAKRYNLGVIEDCAHACGAAYNGQKVCCIGDVGYFSFFVGKNLTCFGGGMITTNNRDIYQKAKGMLKDYNTSSKKILLRNVLFALLAFSLTKQKTFSLLFYPWLYLSNLLNLNLIDRPIEKEIRLPLKIFPVRLSNLQAAIGQQQLARLNQLNAERARNSQILTDQLKLGNKAKIVTVIPEAQSTYLYFPLQVEDRQALRRKLVFRGIDTKEDNLSVCSALEIFKDDQISCPVAEKLLAKNIFIPNYPSLASKDILRIANVILELLNEKPIKKW